MSFLAEAPHTLSVYGTGAEVTTRSQLPATSGEKLPIGAAFRAVFDHLVQVHVDGAINTDEQVSQRVQASANETDIPQQVVLFDMEARSIIPDSRGKKGEPIETGNVHGTYGVPLYLQADGRYSITPPPARRR